MSNRVGGGVGQLHQQVTMDLLLNGSEFVPLSPPLSSVGSGSGSPLPHSYVEVPPEAVAAHNLDPMLSDALAIPRTVRGSLIALADRCP